MKNYIPTLKLSLPSNNLFLETALDFIESTSKVFKFSQEEIFQIRLSSEEAISNIIKHAFANDIEESFEIICLLEPTQFKIILREKGKPFEIEQITPYDPNNVDLQGDAKGLGTFLMQKYMDVVEYKNRGRDGKETILIKYPKAQRFDNLLKNIRSQEKQIDDFEFYIAKFEKKDALGISECAYSAYGYTYESYIYYPSKITEMNHMNVMRSFVAKNKRTQEVIAHMALKYENNPSVTEIGVAFVKKEYRGQSIFTQMLEYVLDSAKAILSLQCIYGKAVTSHTISQKMLLERGGIPTAITLAYFPSDVDFKELDTTVIQKDAALMISINTHQANIIKTIYPPQKHKDVIEKILNELSYNFTSKKSTQHFEPNNEVTKIDYKIIDVLNCANIFCSDYSQDAIGKIHHIVKMLCVNKVDAIYLYLDLENGSVEYIAQECEKLGFFFAGILPYGIENHHAVIYQYLNNIDFHFETLKVADKRSQELKKYIINCYNNVMQ